MHNNNSVQAITVTEKEEIQKLFGLSLEEIDEPTLKKLKKELRAKYHPDNFEKFDDEVVKQMATERFQKIEDLSEKIAHQLSKGLLIRDGNTDGEKAQEAYMNEEAKFSGSKLKIEVITTDKDLKYQLFGTKYRWLVLGDSFKIPNSGGTIIVDEDHKGRKIGFVETIRMYLTFGETDGIENIAQWLFVNIKERAKSLIIGGQTVPVHQEAIEVAIKQKTFLRIGA